jgi:DDE family transposase
MSHQDQRRCTPCPFNHQALKHAMDWLLAGLVVANLKFRNDSGWSPLSLIVTALLWAWSDEKTLTDRWATARKIVQRAWGWVLATSYQAFTKMLRRWSPELLVLLATTFRAQMQSALADRFTVAGFAAFGVDGSRQELPRTASNEARYAPRKVRQRRQGQKTSNGKPRRRRASAAQRADRARHKKATSPQLWLTTMWHVGTGLPWDWRLGPSDSSERAHWLEMLDALPAGALVLADAGFVGYDYWKAVLASGRHVLIRVGANVRLLKQLGYAHERRGRVYLWPDQVAAANQPPLVLRLVALHTGKQPLYVVTSVLDEAVLSDQQVVELYARRWGIELFYRHLKQTFERRKLRSHAADNAAVEAAWSLAGLWAMGLHAQYQLQQQGVPPPRISAAGILRAYRKVLREYKSRPDPGEDLTTLLGCAIVDNYRRRHKASRDYPRKKQGHRIGAPDIRPATSEQKRKAREIKTIEQKG